MLWMECKVDEVDKSDESSELQWEVRSEVEVFVTGYCSIKLTLVVRQYVELIYCL